MTNKAGRLMIEAATRKARKKMEEEETDDDLSLQCSHGLESLPDELLLKIAEFLEVSTRD